MHLIQHLIDRITCTNIPINIKSNGGVHRTSANLHKLANASAIYTLVSVHHQELKELTSMLKWKSCVKSSCDNHRTKQRARMVGYAHIHN